MDRSNTSSSGVSRGLVIVAIPSDREHVWKVSSEKVPHLTLCYLGDQADDDAIIRMTQYLSHVVETSMQPFGLSVKRRGILGDRQAEVLFFDEADTDTLRDVRSYFLANGDIYNAYHSTDQYEKWQPHLTLGYPETPAKTEGAEYLEDSWIRFDRIALWTGPYEGAEFELTRERDEVSMSTPVENFLAQYGIPGMKWGVVKKHLPLVEEVRERGKDAFKIGGADSKDKVVLRDLRKKAEKGGVRTLDDKDLAKLVKRADLENKYRKIRQEEKEASRAFVKALWDGFGKELLGSLIREGVSYKFRGGNRDRSPFRATVVDGNIIERATKALSGRS